MVLMHKDKVSAVGERDGIWKETGVIWQGITLYVPRKSELSEVTCYELDVWTSIPCWEFVL
jgi:hypothetical protein